MARYQEIFGIEIYAYAFMGNHYHLLIRSPKSNTDEFLENVNREISKRINRKYGRSGHLWARRYDDQVILTEEDLLEAFIYVTTNPTHHGLIDDPSKYPGLNSYTQSLLESEREFSFYHHSLEEKVTKHKLKLSVLPPLRELSQSERRQTIKSLVATRVSTLVEGRRSVGEGFLGEERLKLLIPGTIPQKISRSTRPPCYTRSLEHMKEFLKQRRERIIAYAQASFDFRSGILSVEFPVFSFKPPLHRRPRVIPFRPIAPTELLKAA